MLEIDAVGFHYPGAATGFVFDMQVQAGQIVGLVGPSGSGKSTLFDLISGFLDPRDGDIRLDSRSILPLPPERRPVSIVFQNDNLFEHLTTGANIALGLGPKGKASDPQIEAALAQMDLQGLTHRRASNLSGGQKQRVALARTLLRNRPILLLDEPFTGLDAATAEPIRRLIATLVRDNQWHCILVSHQTDDLAALADSVYAIADGRTRLQP